jgi:hypothetical protein
LIVQFNPKVGQQQQVTFRLTSTNEFNKEVYTFKAPSRDADDNEIRILIANVPAGNYLVRSEVDGIESLAGMNQAENIINLKARSSKELCRD